MLHSCHLSFVGLPLLGVPLPFPSEVFRLGTTGAALSRRTIRHKGPFEPAQPAERLCARNGRDEAIIMPTIQPSHPRKQPWMYIICFPGASCHFGACSDAGLWNVLLHCLRIGLKMYCPRLGQISADMSTSWTTRKVPAKTLLNQIESFLFRILKTNSYRQSLTKS